MFFGMPTLLLAFAIMLLVIIFLETVQVPPKFSSFSSLGSIGSLASKIQAFKSYLAFASSCRSKNSVCKRFLCIVFMNSDLIQLVTAILLEVSKTLQGCGMAHNQPRALWRDSLPSVMKPSPLSARWGGSCFVNFLIHALLFAVMYCGWVDKGRSHASPSVLQE